MSNRSVTVIIEFELRPETSHAGGMQAPTRPAIQYKQKFMLHQGGIGQGPMVLKNTNTAKKLEFTGLETDKLHLFVALLDEDFDANTIGQTTYYRRLFLHALHEDLAISLTNLGLVVPETLDIDARLDLAEGTPEYLFHPTNVPVNFLGGLFVSSTRLSAAQGSVVIRKSGLNSDPDCEAWFYMLEMMETPDHIVEQWP